eukprot:SAG31_NODE_451_length_15511_cov_77.547301_11_plen_115_part_00
MNVLSLAVSAANVEDGYGQQVWNLVPGERSGLSADVWVIVDKVTAPTAPGDYVLRWRWCVTNVISANVHFILVSYCRDWSFLMVAGTWSRILRSGEEDSEHSRCVQLGDTSEFG